MEKKRTKFENEVIRRRKRKTLVGGIVVLLILGMSYLFVWERVYTLRLAEENARTRQRVNTLMQRAKTLEYDINQLCSIKRIEDIARREFALIPPREFQLASFTVSAGNKPDTVKAAQSKAKDTVKKQKPAGTIKANKPKTTKSQANTKTPTKKPGTRK
jgi:hypothetical protein